MKIKSKLRSAAELTVSMTIIASLLAACGGGGGGTAATAAATTNTINVTPGKGIMIGALVTIKDALGNVLGSSTTTASGVAPVNVPATATGPFVVTVSCPAGCTYFDEKTLTTVSGSATMPVLQAVVPGVTANIGVTAATHAAAQYAQNTGAPLTPTSIAAANDTVATLMGLPTGTNILTPPTIISNAATYNAAKLGTTAADLLANLSAAFATSAASGVNAVQAIADYGNAWKIAAMTPASGVIMPTTINAASLVAATSGVGGTTGIPVATIPNVAATISATITSIASSTAATSSFLTDISTGGMREFMPGGQYVQVNFNASGVPVGAPVTQTWYATGRTITATLANGIYTVTHTIKELVNRVWTAISPTSNNAATTYVLGTTGWVDSKTLPVTFSISANGTATTNNAFGIPGSYNMAICSADVSGRAIGGGGGASAVWSACNMNLLGGASAVQMAVVGTGVDANGFAANINASGVQATSYVVPTGTFPTGSKKYLVAPVGNSASDIYHLWSSNMVWGGATDANGAAMTALPANNQTFCANGYVFTPIAPAPAAGADNYNVYGTMNGCTASSITAGLLNPAMGTVLLGNQAIGNTTVGIITANNPMNMGFLNNSILGIAGGKVLVGQKYPAGTPLSVINGPLMQMANKTAADAFMTGLGFPLL